MADHGQKLVLELEGGLLIGEGGLKGSGTMGNAILQFVIEAAQFLLHLLAVGDVDHGREKTGFAVEFDQFDAAVHIERCPGFGGDLQIDAAR